MEFVITVLVIGAIAVLAIGSVVLEVIFRHHEVGQIWRSVIDIENKAGQRLANVVSTLRIEEREFAATVRNYERAYVSNLLRRRPIRDLRPYISVSMSWAALERAGIRNLEQFLGFRGNFEHLRGIGEARSRALSRARQTLRREIRQSTLPMPTPRAPGTVEYDVITRLLRIIELRTEVRPSLEALQDKVRHLEKRRPGALPARSQFWLGKRSQLHDELEQTYDDYEALLHHKLPGLEHSAREAGESVRDVEAVSRVYKRREASAKRVVDAITSRDIRGSIRPVGAAALRAAEGFDDEEDFCDRGLEPLIDKMGFDHEREYTIKRRIGSSKKTLYVDFMVYGANGRKVAILEAKRSIRTDRQLKDAKKQALSYALFEELRPMMVAAPEGLWLYERRGQSATLIEKYDVARAYECYQRLRSQIEKRAPVSLHGCAMN